MEKRTGEFKKSVGLKAEEGEIRVGEMGKEEGANDLKFGT